MQNQWDIRYAASEYVYGTDPNDFLQSVVNRMPTGGKILCLAEGEGRNSVFLAKRQFRVTGVDSSAVGLEKAQQLAAKNDVSIETVVADLQHFEIEPETWDGIVSIFCHLPEPLRSQVYRDSVKGLKLGGVFVLEAYTPRQLQFKTGGPPVESLLYEPDSLRESLKGMQFDIFHEIERDVQEGHLHGGPSAVVQVFACKLNNHK